MSFPCISCGGPIEQAWRSCPSCGEAITSFLREYTERPLGGNYQLLSRLGRGGMGEVYRARHIYLQSDCVIKVMRPNIAGDASLIERFLREARVARKIHHPNVALLHEFSGLPDGSFYMVWEFIDGTNLGELIRERGALTPAEVMDLSKQALRGLDAIHRAGFVHRDISPDNLMVTVDDSGEPLLKIIDLGIAKQDTESGETQTATGMFIGKLKYASPEHLGLLNRDERIDGRADLYSLGIVMYEMLSGRAPFIASTPHQFISLQLKEPPPPLPDDRLVLEFVPELQHLIFKALAKERTERFASAREFVETLEAISTAAAQTKAAGHGHDKATPRLLPLPDSREEASPPKPLIMAESSSPVRIRRAVGFSVAALLITSAIAIVMYWNSEKPGSDRPVEIPDFNKAALVEVTTAERSTIPDATTAAADTTEEDRPKDPRTAAPVFRAPRVISRVDPSYPEAAANAELTGVVVVEVSVSTLGTVTSSRVLKGLPMGLNGAALAAVKQWRFSPATVSGKPVESTYEAAITFKALAVKTRAVPAQPSSVPQGKPTVATYTSVRASHILIAFAGSAAANPSKTPLTETEARQKAIKLRSSILKGADFAELAQAESDDTGSAARGGDLGYFSRGQMVPEFEEAAFSTETGALSPVIRTQFGYHVIRVTDRK